jgi:hypothetical protein
MNTDKSNLNIGHLFVGRTISKIIKKNNITRTLTAGEIKRLMPWPITDTEAQHLAEYSLTITNNHK